MFDTDPQATVAIPWSQVAVVVGSIGACVGWVGRWMAKAIDKANDRRDVEFDKTCNLWQAADARNQREHERIVEALSGLSVEVSRSVDAVERIGSERAA
jgi:hypothetical protein